MRFSLRDSRQLPGSLLGSTSRCLHHNHHDLPIFPNLAKDMLPDAPNQLWVADLTYVAIQAGFVYVAVILDAWSRKVVGCAIARSIDVRLTLAALRSAIDKRRPPLGSLSPCHRRSTW